MSNSIETFFGAWGSAGAEAVADAFGDEVYYADPNTPEPIVTLSGLTDYVAMFATHMPGGAAKVVAISEHHGHARATVDFTKDGAAMMRGQYFADLDANGRITRMVGFPGDGAPE